MCKNRGLSRAATVMAARNFYFRDTKEYQQWQTNPTGTPTP
jgi:hypothetical protein